MTPGDVLRCAIRPALSLLPPVMSSPQAEAMLLAIGLQESRFQHRRQVRGPARGYWQFEAEGVRRLFAHEATGVHLDRVAIRLDYPNHRWNEIHPVLEHNDVLAAAVARLNLWWLPRALPTRWESGEAWHQYLDTWRPGKPRPETWERFYTEAWEVVEGNPA